ncbi:hypothetical protein [Mycoplasma sp. Ms02]|uniref:hypothetical protein n=1 Tax=Mycoplasma sp. Ms02 TaxID=353851 RepID=UPI001C89EECE|nr:hypothetical protein [Mycoplasma sp. Ms02]QZE12347.1 hypothetical protein K4L35_03375 [Mycoplasma sp. Ms02]
MSKNLNLQDLEIKKEDQNQVKEQENKKEEEKTKKGSVVFYVIVSILLVLFLALFIFGIIAIVDFYNYQNTETDGLIYTYAQRQVGLFASWFN